MKIYRHLAIAAAVWGCGLTLGFSQSEMMESGSAAPAPSAAPKPPSDKGKMRDFMKERIRESLPPEVRQRFDEARQKALQDPKIQSLQKQVDSANRQFFKAMRDKMMEIDPGLGDLVKNHFVDSGPKKEGKDGKEGGGKRREGGDGTPGIARLNEAERQQLMAARTTAKADPAVQAAEKNRDAATTPAERTAAAEAYHKAMHDALLKADPTIGPVLEKMAPPSKSPTPDVADAAEPMMKQ